MEYLFVHDKQGGGWLKIDSVEKLIDYHQKTNNRYEGALQMYLQGKRPQKMSLEERISLDMDNNKDWKYLQAAIIMAQNVGGTLFDGFRCLNMEFGSKELKDIQEYGACYLNCVGGSTFSVDYMSPLSARQGCCSEATIKLIMDNKYNHALHEFEDCIDDYGKGKGRYLTKNEFILYNCILTCFITRLEEQAENLETMKMVTEQSLRLWENREPK